MRPNTRPIRTGVGIWPKCWRAVTSISRLGCPRAHLPPCWSLTGRSYLAGWSPRMGRMVHVYVPSSPTWKEVWIHFMACLWYSWHSPSAGKDCTLKDLVKSFVWNNFSSTCVYSQYGDLSSRLEPQSPRLKFLHEVHWLGYHTISQGRCKVKMVISRR